MRLSLRAALMTATILGAAPAVAQMADNPMVGGAQMSADQNIIENAVNSADHTTLVAALQAADLVDWLQGDGPFTVFAPVNAAFDALPEGTVDELLMPENAEALHEVLTCHVVGASAMSDAIGQMIADGDGVHMVETLGGCMLELRRADDMITLTDETGGTATVTIADVVQSNGVIHVIDAAMTAWTMALETHPRRKRRLKKIAPTRPPRRHRHHRPRQPRRCHHHQRHQRPRRHRSHRHPRLPRHHHRRPQQHPRHHHHRHRLRPHHHAHPLLRRPPTPPLPL